MGQLSLPLFLDGFPVVVVTVGMHHVLFPAKGLLADPRPSPAYEPGSPAQSKKIQVATVATWQKQPDKALWYQPVDSPSK